MGYMIKRKIKDQLVIFPTSSSLNLPALQILSNSSPPAAYSITMARCVGVNKTWSRKDQFNNENSVPSLSKKRYDSV